MTVVRLQGLGKFQWRVHRIPTKCHILCQFSLFYTATNKLRLIIFNIIAWEQEYLSLYSD
jgi:hypothetical protein